MELIFDKYGCPGLIKGPVIHEKNGNVLTPVLYLRKPKNVSQEKFDQVLKIIIDRVKYE